MKFETLREEVLYGEAVKKVEEGVRLVMDRLIAEAAQDSTLYKEDMGSRLESATAIALMSRQTVSDELRLVGDYEDLYAKNINDRWYVSFKAQLENYVGVTDFGVRESRPTSAMTVNDLYAKCAELMAAGKGEHLVVHPGVAGDIFLEKVYTEEEDGWHVCVITDADEQVTAKRARFHKEGLDLPTIKEWEESQKELARLRRELEVKGDVLSQVEQDYDDVMSAAEDAFKVAGGLQEVLEAIHQAKRRLTNFERCVNIETHQVASVDLQQNSNFTSGSAYCTASLSLYLTQAQGEHLLSGIRKGKARQISMGCKVPFDTCSKCGNISRTMKEMRVYPKSIRRWESNQPNGSDEVKVTLFVDEKTFKYAMLPCLDDNREVKTMITPPVKHLTVQLSEEAVPHYKFFGARRNLEPIRTPNCDCDDGSLPTESGEVCSKCEERFVLVSRDYHAFEEAFVVLRAALIEAGGIQAFVDGVLMQPLVGVIGEAWYEMLVGDTDTVLQGTKVSLPTQGGITSHSYVHLRPSCLREHELKTIYYCGRAHSESDQPPWTVLRSKATCPDCVAKYDKLEAQRDKS